jgi:nitroreductase/FMN reductase [NAD(P)H]
VSSRIAAATQRRFGAAVEPFADLANPDALAALNERSVCRRYRRDPLPEELVRLLCATALAAPTKSDLQQATIVRLADPAKRAAVCALLPGSPWLADAPELLVFCADGWRLRRLFARRGKEFPNEHLDAFFNAAVDAALALGAFVCAAERELDAYDARRGRDWSGDKVKQYSTVLRADFGAFVKAKKFRLV